MISISLHFPTMANILCNLLSYILLTFRGRNRARERDRRHIQIKSRANKNRTRNEYVWLRCAANGIQILVKKTIHISLTLFSFSSHFLSLCLSLLKLAITRAGDSRPLGDIIAFCGHCSLADGFSGLELLYRNLLPHFIHTECDREWQKSKCFL